MTWRPLASVRSLVVSIRFRDTIVFLAPSMVGAAVGLPGWQAVSPGRGLLFLVAGFLLMSHIFAFNDWSDRAADTHSSDAVRRKADASIPDRHRLAFSVFLAATSLLLFVLLSVYLAVIALLILALGVAYSFPVLAWKGKAIPVVASILHFSGTLLTFLLGYTLFNPIDPRAWFIGGYFGLIITAGHLVQEVQDHGGDAAAGVTTNAVRFGPSRMFAIAFGLFSLSFLYVFTLSWQGTIPAPLRTLAALYPAFAWMAWRARSEGLSPGSVRRFRSGYRRLFAVIILLVTLGTLVETLAVPPPDLLR